MKFITLRLSGFKSFVDPTELSLAPGLTGVVGPNGCGKSNLLEALRWVMGESRAKSMRGDGMEDVIFAGAETRPARNFAEVSLLVDNGARTAPAQFNHDATLEVARRITRNAGSAFRVNGKEVRARDVRVLFADAATGPQSPSLVRQGQIGVLIAAKPQGRRKILEDAAGISGLYERRKEVEQRLKAATENLERVDDILTRLDSQIGSLKRQARQADRYAELTEAIKGAAAELVWLRYRAANGEAVAAETAMGEAQRAVASATTAESQAARAREDAETALPPLREEAAVAVAVQQRVLSKREAMDAEVARATETRDRLRRDTGRLRGDLERESELSGDARTAMEALEAEREEVRAIVSDPAAIAAAAQAIVQAEAAVTRAEAARDAAAAKAAAGVAERDSAARVLRDAERALADAAARHAAARKRSEETTVRLQTAATRLTDARETAEAASAAASGMPALCETAEAKRLALEESAASRNAAYTLVQANHAALDAENAVLERGLKADKLASAGGVIDAMRVSPGYERALAAALGDEASAGEAPGFATTLRGWLALAALGGTPVIGEKLAQHVVAPTALARRLTATSVISREEGPTAQARLKPGQRLVSPEGDLWRWDGFFSGADARGADTAALRLERLNRREVLQTEMAGAAQALAEAKRLRDSIGAEMDAARKAETEVRAQAKRAEDAAAAAARALADAEADHARLATSAERLESDVTEGAQAEEAATARLAEARELREGISDPGVLQAGADEARTVLARDRTALDQARTHHAGMVAAETRRTERLAAIRTQLDGWRKRATAADKRHLDLSKRLRDSEAETAKAEGEPERLSASRAGLDAEVAAALARVTVSGDGLAEAEGILREAARLASGQAAALASAREALARAEAMLEGAQARREDAALALREETGSVPEALAERFAGLTGAPDATETRLLKARGDRERLGAVNLRARVEIGEAEAERLSLGTEKDELEAAISKLRTGLAALNREGRERLLAAFTQVNAHFRSLFTHLFGGGEAELQLTESDDPLEAGLEILCQPPGKRVQTLSLLSGGEQTLAAMALIFAVFLVNPAPVCVLDEVDAPLDDANVERFCDLLDEMTRRSDARFLVITHHAVTMSRMNRLFGVTMVERGVSKLVSVDIGAAVRLVEHGDAA